MNSRMEKFAILMLGGARRVSLAKMLIESGKSRGMDVEIISYELTAEVPIAKVAKVITGLKWSDKDVVDDLVRISIENEVRVILPFVDGAIEIASKCKEQLPDVFVPVSDYETSRKMFDKVEAAAEFKKAGLPIPATYSVLNAEIPAIAKPRHGSASRGIKIYYNMEELMHLDNIHGYLIQEYIVDAKEYTVDCYVARDGSVICAVPRERLEVMGGEVTRTATCRNADLESLARQVLDSFTFRGPVTLQFLRDKSDGRFLLMEVNPRLGGGVICSVAAGADIPGFIIQEALGIKPAKCEDWKAGILMARYWEEVIFNLNDNAGE